MSESQNSELLPCPFCGETDLRVAFSHEAGRWDIWEVECESCCVSKDGELGFTGHDARMSAIAAWNKRIQPGELSDENARLKEALKTAATTFRRYAELHRAKGTTEGNLKASNNDDLAEFCEGVIDDCKTLREIGAIADSRRMAETPESGSVRSTTSGGGEANRPDSSSYNRAV